MPTPFWMTHVESLKQALAQKDRAATNAAMTALLDANAPIGQQWLQMSELMRMSGEITLAHRAMDAFVNAMRGSAQAQYSRVVLLTQTGRLAEAHDLLATLPANVPDPAGHAYVLGNTAATLGRFDEARTLLRRAVTLRPGWGAAWLTLASSVDFSKDQALLDALMADERAAQKMHDLDRASYHFAQGKALSDQKDSETAFTAFEAGARLFHRNLPYQRSHDDANAAEAMRGWTPSLIDQANARVIRDTSRPIFVTGLPRSGTTLVEQILASHSAVADGGELNIAQHLPVRIGSASGEAFAQWMEKGGNVDELAGLYLHLLGERCPAPGRIVDKTIDASRFLGTIAAALPDAPLIWMRRDPLDCAWSCYRTYFAGGVAWSYSLTDIAHHFLLEDAMCQFWQNALGERLLVVPYSDLVDAPDDWTRRILSHCGLKEEEGVHRFHETDRAVATASAMQVRRPINRDGMGVAEPYGRQMRPFLDAYKPKQAAH